MNSIVRFGLGVIIALLLLTVMPAAGTLGNDDSAHASISEDGRYVVYDSKATNLVAGDTNVAPDIFVRDRNTGTTWLISKSSAGVMANGGSNDPSVSSDGRYVAFDSGATNLVAGDTNGKLDIFVRDRQSGTTYRVSTNSAGAEGDGDSHNPAISADGRYVAFWSDATNLVAGDTNSVTDIFVRDRQSGTTWLVSKNSAGAEGNGNSYNPFISADGRYVTFFSEAINLVSGDTNGWSDVFVRDRQTGMTYLVSKSSAGVEGDSDSLQPSLSSDGRYVAFNSYATNLVAGDTNGMSDIFVRDRQSGTTWLVSKNSAGAEGNGNSYNPFISAGGRYMAFESGATNLASGDTNGMSDIFVRDRQSGTTYRVSTNSAGGEGNDDSYDSSISTDGRYVAFESWATNLVAGDTNGMSDIFVRDRQSGTTWLVSKS